MWGESASFARPASTRFIRVSVALGTSCCACACVPNLVFVGIAHPSMAGISSDFATTVRLVCACVCACSVVSLARLWHACHGMAWCSSVARSSQPWCGDEVRALQPFPMLPWLCICDGWVMPKLILPSPGLATAEHPWSDGRFGIAWCALAIFPVTREAWHTPGFVVLGRRRFAGALCIVWLPASVVGLLVHAAMSLPKYVLSARGVHYRGT